MGENQGRVAHRKIAQEYRFHRTHEHVQVAPPEQQIRDGREPDGL